jgi:hypothetical protein
MADYSFFSLRARTVSLESLGSIVTVASPAIGTAEATAA